MHLQAGQCGNQIGAKVGTEHIFIFNRSLLNNNRALGVKRLTRGFKNVNLF